ncbi:MAG: hypothetical protein ACR2NZ_06795 [Rubripirellula sp.]
MATRDPEPGERRSRDSLNPPKESEIGDSRRDDGGPLLARRTPDDSSPERQERLRQLDSTRAVEWLEEVLPHPLPIQLSVRRRDKLGDTLRIMADQFAGSDHEPILRGAADEGESSFRKAAVRAVTSRILGITEATHHGGVQVVISDPELWQLVLDDFLELAAETYAVKRHASVVTVGDEPAKAVRFVSENAGYGQSWVPAVYVTWRVSFKDNP